MRVMRLYQISLQAESPHLKTLQNSCEGYFCSITCIILSLLKQSITDAGLVKDNLNDFRIQEIM